ncbi:dienelactone hydrolase family protein [Roseateles sp. LKC17W]|uniref:Dienelactone hydrolase family protein n=1 Tax=Pelomonas margarita TaxID=3299031 RepID=A0ABW7FES6_9BURK
MAWQGWKGTALTALAALATWTAGPARAHGEHEHGAAAGPAVSFVQFSSPNLTAPGTPLTVQGKLSVPRQRGWHGHRKLPAVVIVHGSAGIDARGDFYEAALNDAGIATLQIDMWQARGYTAPGQRPAAPILTYPDAFSALQFLAQQPGIDGARVGVLGFSWGGLVSMGTAERLYAGQFGGGRTFKAHVAHYPVCYAWNNAPLLAAVRSTPAQYGVQWLALTGAPVLIQVGTKDDYDNSAKPCQDLAAAANASNGSNSLVRVVAYPDATHGWDRLMVPMTVNDPFANQGSFFSTGVPPAVKFTPDAEQAYQSRARVVRFFERQL